MARRNKAQRNLNTSKRLTPHDAIVGNSIDRPPAVPKEPPRDPTSAEMRGNNTAAVEYNKLLGNLLRWIPMFLQDLALMNAGKVGRPFEFSDLQILWMSSYMAKNSATYRDTAGFLGAVLSCFGLSSPSYSRLQERSTELIGRMMMRPDEELRSRYGESVYFLHVNGNVVERARNLGLDSSGMSLSSPNRYRKKKWKSETKDRGWVKFHALCDVDSGEIIACAVTDETVGDSRMLKVLVGAALDKGHRIAVVYGDNAYCGNENWRYLCNEKGIRFVTSFQVSTVPKSNGCMMRGQAAKLWCSLPYDEWVKVSGYGTRWKCEVDFSSFKTMFGETLAARSIKGIIKEMASKIMVFDDYKKIRAEIIGVTGNGVVIG